MCAVYAPRDPIAEFWQGRLSLRALHALIVHMPPDNVFYRALGDGWTEGERLTHDVGDMLRDLQITLVNINPLVKRQVGDDDVRPRILPPNSRKRNTTVKAVDDGRSRREREELMALALGR